MKTSSALATSACFFLPFTTALVGWTWDIDNIPSDGLRDIVFPLNIANAQHKEGYYFAQQFPFVGIPDIGYTGLQPRKDTSNGTSVIHAAFSSFQNGTTSTDPNCNDGADGGPGVSCAVDFEASYDPTYHIYVKNTQDTTWEGTVINPVTGFKVHIGTFKLPAEAKGISGGHLGFIEDYFGHECAELPYMNITVGIPMTTTTDTGMGKIEEPYEYGDCEGMVDFDTEYRNGNWEVSCGF